MVQLLLLKGADKDAFDNQRWTPLYLAASFGYFATTLIMLAAGADVSLRCCQSESPVIQMAARKGHGGILRVMIEHGADVNAVNRFKSTALHAAVRNNRMEIIDMLVRARASIEARNYLRRKPLHESSDYLSRDSLLCLLKHDATANAKDDTGRTPLMAAAINARKQGAAEVVDSLPRAGADETIDAIFDIKTSGLMVQHVEEQDRLAEDFERVRELLVKAPADRAWHRRGYLVSCRAHPDRVQQSQVIGGIHHTDTARRTRSRAKLARVGVIAPDSTVDESTDGDWTVVVAKVLLLQEEGVFRTITGLPVKQTAEVLQSRI